MLVCPLFSIPCLEQYSLSHDLRFQYINHVEAIRVPKIDDIKDMNDTQVGDSREHLTPRTTWILARRLARHGNHRPVARHSTQRVQFTRGHSASRQRAIRRQGQLCHRPVRTR